MQRQLREGVDAGNSCDNLGLAKVGFLYEPCLVPPFYPPERPSPKLPFSPEKVSEKPWPLRDQEQRRYLIGRQLSCGLAVVAPSRRLYALYIPPKRRISEVQLQDFFFWSSAVLSPGPSTALAVCARGCGVRAATSARAA